MNKEKTCGASLAGTAVSSPQLRAPLKDQTVRIKDELLLPGGLWFAVGAALCVCRARRAMHVYARGLGGPTDRGAGAAGGAAPRGSSISLQ